MKKLIVLILISTLFNGCMVKRIFKGGHAGKSGHNEHSRMR